MWDNFFPFPHRRDAVSAWSRALHGKFLSGSWAILVKNHLLCNISKNIFWSKVALFWPFAWGPCFLIEIHQSWKIRKQFLGSQMIIYGPFHGLKAILCLVKNLQILKIHKLYFAHNRQSTVFINRSFVDLGFFHGLLSIILIDKLKRKTVDHTSESSMCWSAVWQREAFTFRQEISALTML